MGSHPTRPNTQSRRQELALAERHKPLALPLLQHFLELLFRRRIEDFETFLLARVFLAVHLLPQLRVAGEEHVFEVAVNLRELDFGLPHEVVVQQSDLELA